MLQWTWRVRGVREDGHGPMGGGICSWNKLPSRGAEVALAEMASAVERPGPCFVDLVERLSYTLFHLRNNRDCIHMKTVLEIFVTFLTVSPNINEGGSVVEDTEQMVMRTSGLYLHK